MGGWCRVLGVIIFVGNIIGVNIKEINVKIFFYVSLIDKVSIVEGKNCCISLILFYVY